MEENTEARKNLCKIFYWNSAETLKFNTKESSFVAG